MNNIEVVEENPQIIDLESRLAFFEKIGVEYTLRLVVAEYLWGSMQRLKVFSQQYFEEEFNTERSRRLNDKAQKIDNRNGNKLLDIVFINDEIGYGCFAAEDIPENSLIDEYAGILGLESDNPTSQYMVRYGGGILSKIFQDHPLVVDAGEIGNETRFINHVSSDAMFLNTDGVYRHGRKLKFDGGFYDGIFHVLAVTAQDVRSGEELRMDYGPHFTGLHGLPDSLYFLNGRGELVKLPKMD